MSTLKVNTIQNTSGVEVYTAKAWVNFNGTGTVAIRAAGNVSSITDNSVGDYTVNFTTAMPDGNYSVNTTTSSDSTSIVTSGITGNSSVLTTTSVRVATWSTSAQVDRTVVAVAIFR